MFAPQEIQAIIKKYKLELLIYFGSYGTEYYNMDSDIDIAFLSCECLSMEQIIELMEDLIKLHKKSEIDIVDLKSAEPVLRYEIALNGRVLYEKEENLFERYRLFYIKRFYELKPVIEEELRQIAINIEDFVKTSGMNY